MCSSRDLESRVVRTNCGPFSRTLRAGWGTLMSPMIVTRFSEVVFASVIVVVGGVSVAVCVRVVVLVGVPFVGLSWLGGVV